MRSAGLLLTLSDNYLFKKLLVLQITFKYK